MCPTECSFMMEYDIHTVLDAMTLIATAGVIFCMLVQAQIRVTYQKDQDRLKFYYVVRRGSQGMAETRNGLGLITWWVECVWTVSTSGVLAHIQNPALPVRRASPAQHCALVCPGGRALPGAGVLQQL